MRLWQQTTFVYFLPFLSFFTFLVLLAFQFFLLIVKMSDVRCHMPDVKRVCGLMATMTAQHVANCGLILEVIPECCILLAP